MTIVTRTTAKSYFETGDKPTQSQFTDFIDSALFYEDTSDFGRSLISASAAGSARSLLGAGAVGDKIITATTTASVQNNIGAGTFGKILFETNTTASALTNFSFGTAALKNVGTSAGEVPVIGTNSATTILAGLVELLTDAELKTGTDTTRSPTASNILAALGFSAYFQSAQQTITSSGTLTIAHGLGRTPILYKAFLVCTDAGGEHGYTQGQETEALQSDLNTSGTGSGVTLIPDATNLNVQYASNVNAFYVLKRSATVGDFAGITNSKWRLVLRAWA